MTEQIIEGPGRIHLDDVREQGETAYHGLDISAMDWMLSDLAELLILFDWHCRALWVNQAFLDRSGYSCLEARSLGLDALFDRDTARDIRTAFLREGSGRELDAVLQTMSGGQVPVRLRASGFRGPDGTRCYLLACTDRSEWFELMERVQKGRKQLAHSSRLASLGAMAAGMGHELVQPLNAILLFARNCRKALAQAGVDQLFLRENIEMIIDRVSKASSIIDTMRSFGRKEEEALVPVDLGAILRKILGLLETQLRLGEIELELRLAEGPCEVAGVEARLEQVFLNLAQNAIQSMGGTSSPRLSIASTVTKRLNLKNMREEDYAVVTVADNGEGMSEEVRKKIFDPFFTTREAGIGMGLGLAIIDRIIQGFSGYIEVESRVGQGSCFSVFLPLYQGETAGLAAEDKKFS